MALLSDARREQILGAYDHFMKRDFDSMQRSLVSLRLTRRDGLSADEHFLVVSAYWRPFVEACFSWRLKLLVASVEEVERELSKPFKLVPFESETDEDQSRIDVENPTSRRDEGTMNETDSPIEIPDRVEAAASLNKEQDCPNVTEDAPTSEELPKEADVLGRLNRTYRAALEMADRMLTTCSVRDHILFLNLKGDVLFMASRLPQSPVGEEREALLCEAFRCFTIAWRAVAVRHVPTWRFYYLRAACSYSIVVEHSGEGRTACLNAARFLDSVIAQSHAPEKAALLSEPVMSETESQLYEHAQCMLYSRRAEIEERLTCLAKSCSPAT